MISRILVPTALAAALCAALAGCGSEPVPEGPLGSDGDPSPSSSPSATGSADSDLPAFTRLEAGDAMHLTQPPAPVDSKRGAIDFAVYHESIPADGFEPPVADLLEKTAAADCEGCAQQLKFVRGFVADGNAMVRDGDTTYRGVVDAAKFGQQWQVIIEYSIPGAHSEDASGKKLQAYAPAKFTQTLSTLAFRGGQWVVTRSTTDSTDSSQTGPNS